MKYFIAFFVVLGTFLLGLTAVMAAPDIGIGTNGMASKIAVGSGYDASTNQYSVSATIGRIIKVVLTLVGTIFFVLTVYAGILWMTAGGNEENVTKATGIMKMAVIGLIIVLASYSLTYFVTNKTVQATRANIIK